MNVLAQKETWAKEVFGGAKLGHARRTRRLVKMAAAVANNPRGQVRASVPDKAAQKAAYRFLRADGFTHQNLLEAACAAAVSSSDEPLLLAPIDFTSHNLSDPSRRRDLGRVGKANSKSRGLHVASALVVGEDGCVHGLGGQLYFKRQSRKRTQRQKAKRKAADIDEKESKHWVTLAREVLERVQRQDDPQRLWFQLDRGADAHQILAQFGELEADFTVRLAQNRRASAQPGKPKLFETVASQPLAGTLELQVPARQGRSKRSIVLECRFAQLRVPLFHSGSREPYTELACSVVELRERGASVNCTDKSGKLCWRLLTSYRVENLDDALRVVHAYRLRWRIEEFHRSWKHDCKIERHGLRSFEAIARWSVINAAVAVRTEHIKRESREHPDADALSVFSEEELEAIIALRHGPKFRRPKFVPLGEATLWLGELGGYTNASSAGKRPPGTTLLARGLERIAPVVQLLEQGYRLGSRRSG